MPFGPFQLLRLGRLWASQDSTQMKVRLSKPICLSEKILQGTESLLALSIIQGFLRTQRPSARYPPCRAIPFRDSIAEGGIPRVLPCFAGYRASIAEIPLSWGGGVSHLHFACSPSGKHSAKGGRIAPKWPC